MSSLQPGIAGAIGQLGQMDDVTACEHAVGSALDKLVTSLQKYRNELAKQDIRLQESKSLMLDQLTDENASSVIRNITKRLEEKDSELRNCERKCEELKEKNRTLEIGMQSKSSHIEKLSSLLLSKEEKIHQLEDNCKDLKSRMASVENLLEAKAESVDKWRQAAQQAASKMRDNLVTLKASEEMNQDLKRLLDKQIDKQSNPAEKTTVSPSGESFDLTDLVTKVLGGTGHTTVVSTPLSSHHHSSETTPISTRRQPEVVYRMVESPASRSTSTPKSMVPTSSGVSERYSLPPASPLAATMVAEKDEDPGTPRVRFKIDDLADAATFATVCASPSDGMVRYPAPLPNFSKIVADGLDSERIHDPVLWRYFIRECVHFYYDVLPSSDSAAKTSYYNIGRTLFDKYPCIAKEGPSYKTPWTYFNTCLSSRLRNERFSKKRASERRLHYATPTQDDPPIAAADTKTVTHYVTSGEFVPVSKRMRVEHVDDVITSEAEQTRRWTTPTTESCHL